MTKSRLPVLYALPLLLVGIGACGSGHNESTASVCAKLKVDLPNAASSAPQNLDQAESELKTLADKIASDTSNAKDANIRNAGKEASDSLKKAVDQATSGSKSAAASALQQAATAASQIKSQCPAT